MITIDFENFKKEFYCAEKNILELNQSIISLSKDFFSDEDYLSLLDEFKNLNELLKNKSKNLYTKVIVRTKYFEVTYLDAIISSINNSKLCISLNNFIIIGKPYSRTNLLLEIIKPEI